MEKEWMIWAYDRFIIGQGFGHDGWLCQDEESWTQSRAAAGYWPWKVAKDLEQHYRKLIGQVVAVNARDA